MIYYKADENKKVSMFTKSEQSAADYNLIDSCEDDGLEQAYNGSWYLKGYAPQEPESEKKAKRKEELKKQLDVIDLKCIRALRAIQAGTGTDDDTARLAELEEQAGDIRQQIQDLQGE